MAKKNVLEDQDVGWLIEKFENNIIYDCHNFISRFERSQARKELQKMGRLALRPIIDHLKANPPSGFMDLIVAWNKLLNWIEVDIDPDKTGPADLRDTIGWIAWAEKFA